MKTSPWAAWIVGPVVLVCLHVVIWRLKPSKAPRIFLLFLLGGIGIAISETLEFLLAGELTPHELFSVLWVGLFFVVVYSAVHSVLARSVSLTILTWLLDQGDQPMDFNLLCQKYQSSSRYEDRVYVMRDANLLSISGSAVSLTAKGWRLARAAEILARIFSDGLEG